MALHFSYACQTGFAYRSLTASLLKRFKIQNLIGVELLWHGIDGGIFKIAGNLPLLLLKSEIMSGKEDEAALETKVQFLPVNLKRLELFREAVNGSSFQTISTPNSLQKSSAEFCPPWWEYWVVKNGCIYLAYLNIWTFHWCTAGIGMHVRMYPPLGMLSYFKSFWCSLVAVFTGDFQKAPLKLKGANSIKIDSSCSLFTGEHFMWM